MLAAAAAADDDNNSTVMHIFLYIVLFQQILAFLLSSFSVYCSGALLWTSRKSKDRQCSPLLCAYFGYVFLYSATNIVYHIYMFIFWRSDTVIYDARILYAIGFIPWISLYLNGAVESFICIERCFYVLFPTRYNEYKKRWYAGIACFMLGILMSVVIYMNDMIAIFPSSPETTCRFFGCFITGQQQTFYIRFVCISVNVISAVVLFLIIKISLNSSNSSVKRMNKTVLIMVGCTTILELIPLLASQIFFWVFQINGYTIMKYIGPYAVTGTTVILALSVSFYYKVFKKSNNSTGIVKIFNTASTYFTTTMITRNEGASVYVT